MYYKSATPKCLKNDEFYDINMSVDNLSGRLVPSYNKESSETAVVGSVQSKTEITKITKITKEEHDGRSRVVGKPLSYHAFREMINKLLSRNRINAAGELCLKYTQEELAEIIGITLNEFEQFETTDFYRKRVNKITLPLVKLYCSTKWVDD